MSTVCVCVTWVSIPASGRIFTFQFISEAAPISEAYNVLFRHDFILSPRDNFTFTFSVDRYNINWDLHTLCSQVLLVWELLDE
jgi:hypothetical protein